MVRGQYTAWVLPTFTVSKPLMMAMGGLGILSLGLVMMAGAKEGDDEAMTVNIDEPAADADPKADVKPK